MALVNPNIAMGFQQPNFTPRNALAEYAQIQQIQGGQQTQDLNALKMQEYQRARGEEEGLRNYLTKTDSTNPEYRRGLLQFGLTGREYGKVLREEDTAALNAKNLQSQINERDFNLQDKKLKFSWNAVGSSPTPEAAIAELNKGIQNKIFDATSANQEIETIKKFTTSEEYQKYRNEKIIGILDAKDKLTFILPSNVRQDIGGSIVSIQNNPALPGYGQPIAGANIAKTETFADKTAKGQLKVSQGQLVVSQGRLKNETDLELQQKLSNARATGEAIGKGDVAAIKALPKILSDAERGINLIDQLIGKRDFKTGQLLKGEKTYAGFEDAVGATLLPGARFVPGSEAAGFMSRFDQIKGASFLEAFESLKGGGAITEKEGSKGTDAINRMSISTKEDEFIRAAMDLQEVIRTGVKNARSRTAQAVGRTTPAAAASAPDPLGIR